MKDLAKPFDPKDIEWRVGRSGTSNNKPWAMVLAYLNARAVMDRLDEVVGPERWKDRYWSDGKSIMCGLSIKVGDEWVEKIDGSEETEIEAVKGGISGAFKRAAVKWGVGRYLYNLEEGFAQIVDKSCPGASYAKTKEGTVFYWTPPELPGWARPSGPKQEELVLKNLDPSNVVVNDQGRDFMPNQAPGVFDVRPVTKKQLERLFAIADKAMVPDATVKGILKQEFGLDSSRKLNMDQYDKLVTMIQGLA